MEDIENIFEGIRRYFDKKDAVWEETFSICRKIVRNCGDAIRTLHRGYEKKNIAVAKKILSSVKKDISALSVVKSEHPDIFYSGFVEQAMQEYSEAEIMLAVVSGEKFPAPEKLNVTYSSYLLGLADFTGEMRRMVLNMIRKKELKSAERYFKIMEEIYGVLMGFDYPAAVLPIRQKQDMARSIVEKTMGELVIAMQRKDIEDKMSEFSGLLDELEKPKKEKKKIKKEPEELDINSVWR